MKRLIIISIVFSLLVITPFAITASIKCGIKPIPPIGCSSASAQCVCDADGNCNWVFIGC